MRYYALFALPLALGLSLSTAFVAQAKDSDSNHISLGLQVGATTSTNVGPNGKTDAHATSSARATTTREGANEHASSTKTQGIVTAEAHQSVVASFVHSLLDVADRESGIGAQVRVIAQEQSDSEATTSEAIAIIDGRSALKTFLIGSDYRNLGALRSHLAVTEKHIAALKILSEKAVNASDRTELDAQIKTLEDEQVKLDAFVTAHETRFSLFGWFTKFFVNVDAE